MHAVPTSVVSLTLILPPHPIKITFLTPITRYPTLPYPTLRYPTLSYATLRYATLHYTTLHYPTLSYPIRFGNTVCMVHPRSGRQPRV